MGRLISTIAMMLSLAMVAGCGLKQSYTVPQTVQSVSVVEQPQPDVSQIQQWLAEGRRYEAEGEHRLAMITYLKCLSQAPRQVEALLSLARLKIQRGDIPAAEQLYLRVLEVEPQQMTAVAQLGVIALGRQQLDAAQGYLQQAVLIGHQVDQAETDTGADPAAQVLRRAYNGLAVIADMAGDYPQAQRFYSRALKRSPDDQALINNRGYSHYLASRWQLAEQSYRQALRLSPEYLPAQRNLALLYTRQGKYMEALQLFRPLEGEAGAYREVGYICMVAGRYKRARYFLQQARQRAAEPDKLAEKHLLRVLRLQQGQQAGNTAETTAQPS